MIALGIEIVLFYKNRESTAEIELSAHFWGAMLLAFILVFVWCYLSGIGGHVTQAGDWIKHNFILKDLIDKLWPVYYNYNGMSGVMCYYIAEYLIPAVFGMLFGFDAASDFLLFWCTIGIMLAVILAYKEFGKVHDRYIPWVMPIIALALQ